MKELVTIHTQALKWDWETDFRISHSSTKTEPCNGLLVIDLSSTEVEISYQTLNEEKILNSEIEFLQKSRQKLLSEATRYTDAINDKILLKRD